jgi:hypothetical protein
MLSVVFKTTYTYVKLSKFRYNVKKKLRIFFFVESVSFSLKMSILKKFTFVGLQKFRSQLFLILDVPVFNEAMAGRKLIQKKNNFSKIKKI